jgi:hypothetical protein
MIVAAAQAARKPSATEREQIAAVVKLPVQCAKVKVSTASKKPLWGSASFKPGPSECESHASNGDTIVKKSRGRWRFVTAGSSFDCPSLYKKVPQAIAKDLHIACF